MNSRHPYHDQALAYEHQRAAERPNNAPLYLLACLAAFFVSGAITGGLLWAAWWGLVHGPLWLAVGALWGLLCFVVVLFVAKRAGQTQHYRVKP